MSARTRPNRPASRSGSPRPWHVERLLAAASAAFGSPVTDLRLTAGVITDDADRRSDIGALARRAASRRTIAVTVELVVPRAADLTVVGHPPTASPPETG